MLLLRRTLTSQNRYCVSQYRYLSSKLPTAQANSSNLKGFNIDNNDMFDKNRVSVRGFGDTCFVVNDAMIEQSIILLPHNVLLWNVKKFEDITIDSLSIFPL